MRSMLPSGLRSSTTPTASSTPQSQQHQRVRHDPYAPVAVAAPQQPRRSVHMSAALLLLATCLRPMQPLMSDPTAQQGHGPYGGYAPAGQAPANHHNHGNHGAHSDAPPVGYGPGWAYDEGMHGMHYGGDADGFVDEYEGHEFHDAQGDVDFGEAPEQEPPRVRSSYAAYNDDSHGESSTAALADSTGVQSDDDEDDEDDEKKDNEDAVQYPDEKAEDDSDDAVIEIAEEEEDEDAMSIQSSQEIIVDDADVVPAEGGEVRPAAAGTAGVAVAAAVLGSNKKKASTPHGLVALDDKVLANVASFLSLDDIAALRGASTKLAKAADAVAPQPFGGAAGVSFVRWAPQSLKTQPLELGRTGRRGGQRGKSSKPAVAATVPYEWRCLACSGLNNGNRACSLCGADTAQSACRVFLGQLRKDLTAELVAHMVALVCPDVVPLHIESHTNGHTGRGKGCAWVYLNSTSDAVRLTSTLHKRAFIDIDANDGEGFWYVAPSADAEEDAHRVETLSCFATERAAATASNDDVAGECPAPLPAGMRHPLVMPRQPVVAEVPAKSLLARLTMDAFDA